MPCLSQEEAISSRWGLNVENEINVLNLNLIYSVCAISKIIKEKWIIKNKKRKKKEKKEEEINSAKPRNKLK